VTAQERALAVAIGWDSEAIHRGLVALAGRYRPATWDAEFLPQSLRACTDIGRRALEEYLAPITVSL
jgi:hypothetical protein